jgi:hypothetical protein
VIGRGIERKLLTPLHDVLNEHKDCALQEDDNGRVKRHAQPGSDPGHIKMLWIEAVERRRDTHDRSNKPYRRDQPRDVTDELIFKIQPMADQFELGGHGGAGLLCRLGVHREQDGGVDERRERRSRGDERQDATAKFAQVVKAQEDMVVRRKEIGVQEGFLESSPLPTMKQNA